MERFAVIALPGEENRIMERHPVLHRLPQWWKKVILTRIMPECSKIIWDAENNEKLGYIVDIPSFFIGWDKLSDSQRGRQLDGLIECLEAEDVNIISFPYWNNFLSRDDIGYLNQCGFTILDGYKLRMGTLAASVRHLMGFLSQQRHILTVGVWRADTDVGEAWAKYLSQHVNYLTLGGEKPERLNQLADEILSETGLSSEITTRVDVCTMKKDIIVFTDEEMNALPSPVQLYAGSLNFLYQERAVPNSDHIVTESGYMPLPEDVRVDRVLKPWEEAAVLGGLFYVISQVYREMNTRDHISCGDIENLEKLFKRYPMKPRGFIAGNRCITFDRFRMNYLRSLYHRTNQSTIG